MGTIIVEENLVVIYDEKVKACKNLNVTPFVYK